MNEQRTYEELYNVIVLISKKDIEILSFSTAWKNLEINMFNEISQLNTPSYHICGI